MTLGEADIQVAVRRRIIVLPSEYPDFGDPLRFNGSWAEEQTRELSRYHRVAVVYPCLAESEPSGLSVNEFRGVRTGTVRYRHVRKTWVAPYVLAAWRGFRAMSRGQRPDCIHAHGLYPAGFAAVLIGRAQRIPVVITEHWGQLSARTAASRLIRAVLRFTIRKATRVVAVSSFLADEILTLEPRCHVSVVANIVDPGFFNVVPSRAFENCEHLQLLFVGSLRDYRKGLDDTLYALRTYLDSPSAKPCRLTIIGDGDKRSEFEGIATRLGLADRCTFLGNRSRAQVREAMAACDVFIMPSKYETFGVVYAEAMACGKPVIACQGGAAEEIVPPEAGVLVPPGDLVALAAAIGDIMIRRTQFDSEAIRASAESRFGSAAIVQALSEVYEDAIRVGAGCG